MQQPEGPVARPATGAVGPHLVAGPLLIGRGELMERQPPRRPAPLHGHREPRADRRVHVRSRRRSRPCHRCRKPGSAARPARHGTTLPAVRPIPARALARRRPPWTPGRRWRRVHQHLPPPARRRGRRHQRAQTRAALASRSSLPGTESQLEVVQNLIRDLSLERMHSRQYPRDPHHPGGAAVRHDAVPRLGCRTAQLCLGPKPQVSFCAFTVHPPQCPPRSQPARTSK